MPLDLSVSHQAIATFKRRLLSLMEYTFAVLPAMKSENRFIEVLVDSTVVLLAAWHEQFLSSIIANAVIVKESHVRAVLSAGAGGSQLTMINTCNRIELVKLAKRRIDLREKGSRLDRLFRSLWGFGVWPSDDVRYTVIDMNLLRQLIVHHGGGIVGDAYLSQFSDLTLLDVRRYGDLPPVAHIQYGASAAKLKPFISALIAQAQHIEDNLAKAS